MTPITKANGRPRKPYPASWGEAINGLRRRSDGRWVVVETGQMFSEPDERRAVERFRRLTGELTGAQRRMMERPNPFAATVDEILILAANEIRTRPQYCAKIMGIEQIGYLLDLPRPEEVPSITAMEQTWETHATCAREEKRKVLRDWRIFVAETGITSIRGITADIVVAFRNHVYGLGLGGKRQQHLFNHIRRMVTFVKGQAQAVKTCAGALEVLALLRPNESSITLDPTPISPDDFRALLAHATGQDRAMLLLCLNAALYLQEAVSMTWDCIQGDTLIAHRKKKGKYLRIATLWPETVTALAELPRTGTHIFMSATGLPLTVSGAGKRFRRIRKAAAVERPTVATVEANHVRDGAATATAAANVNSQIFALLMGHRSGIKDHYAKRNPGMVRPACDAVYRAYGPF